MTELSFKVSLCGEPGVGKTSIALRQAQDSFPISHQPTLGANFLIWNTTIEGQEIRIIIGDSGSQEKFLPILPTYFIGSVVAALVFDITKKESFDRLDFWHELLKETVGNIPVVIIGNKLDLEESREVTKEEATRYAESINTVYFEVSAKANVNLFTAFKKIATIAIESDSITAN
ncbi:MAG: Rab family GTPase [Candidatus Heimdallarchaeaceae archaeon]